MICKKGITYLYISITKGCYEITYIILICHLFDELYFDETYQQRVSGIIFITPKNTDVDTNGKFFSFFVQWLPYNLSLKPVKLRTFIHTKLKTHVQDTTTQLIYTAFIPQKAKRPKKSLYKNANFKILRNYIEFLIFDLIVIMLWSYICFSFILI